MAEKQDLRRGEKKEGKKSRAEKLEEIRAANIATLNLMPKERRHLEPDRKRRI